MSLPTLINLTLFAAFLYVCYRSLRRALRHRQSTTEPTCAHCGYTVLHLPTPTCPECGSGLLLKGIFPPGRASYRLALPVAWTACVLIAANVSSLPLMRFRYHQYTRTFNLSLSNTALSPLLHLATYAEGYSTRLSAQGVTATAIGPSASGTSTSATFVSPFGDGSEIQSPVPAGPRGSIAYDFQSRQWSLTTPARSLTSASLAPSQVDQWLTRLGFPPDHTRARELYLSLIAARDASDLRHFDPSVAAPMPDWESNGSGLEENNLPAPSSSPPTPGSSPSSGPSSSAPSLSAALNPSAAPPPPTSSNSPPPSTPR